MHPTQVRNLCIVCIPVGQVRNRDAAQMREFQAEGRQLRHENAQATLSDNRNSYLATESTASTDCLRSMKSTEQQRKAAMTAVSEA